MENGPNIELKMKKDNATASEKGKVSKRIKSWIKPTLKGAACLGLIVLGFALKGSFDSKGV